MTYECDRQHEEMRAYELCIPHPDAGDLINSLVLNGVIEDGTCAFEQLFRQ